MDPIKKLSPLIVNQIFNNLTANDLKVSMEVSESWCNFIESSASCMDKFCLSLRREPGPHDFLRMRNYQHIRVTEIKHYWLFILNQFSCDGKPCVSKKPSTKWKSLHLEGTRFETTLLLFMFLNTFLPTIEELRLSDVDIELEGYSEKTKTTNRRSLEMRNLELDFSKLKVLEISDTFSISKISKSTSDLKSFFQSMINLKELRVPINILTFDFDGTSLPFQLERLTITSHSYHIAYADTLERLRIFLISQPSIKSLKINVDVLMPYTLLNTILQCKNIKSLCLEAQFSVIKCIFPPNHSIESFETNRFQSVTCIEDFIKSMKCMRHFKLTGKLIVNTSEFLAANVKHLETVTATDFQNIYRTKKIISKAKVAFASEEDKRRYFYDFDQQCSFYRFHRYFQRCLIGPKQEAIEKTRDEMSFPLRLFEKFFHQFRTNLFFNLGVYASFDLFLLSVLKLLSILNVIKKLRDGNELLITFLQSFFGITFATLFATAYELIAIKWFKPDENHHSFAMVKALENLSSKDDLGFHFVGVFIWDVLSYAFPFILVNLFLFDANFALMRQCDLMLIAVMRYCILHAFVAIGLMYKQTRHYDEFNNPRNSPFRGNLSV